jgi:hypothetical protein
MNWPKAIAVAIGSLCVGAILMLQAIANVSANDNPVTAARATLLNGFALEYLAVDRLAVASANGESLPEAARSLKPVILQTLRAEPLTPRALTILAMGQEEEKKRAEILLAAEQVSRRPLMLQTNLLLYHTSRNDFPNSIATLNRILAVHPEQREVMFPALVQALKDARSIDSLVQVLRDQPGWGESFMKAAARHRDAIDNLARVRMGLLDKTPVDRTVDQAIVAGLVNAGRLEPAAALYENISRAPGSRSSRRSGGYGNLDWKTQIPPFDWQLSNDSGERAQIIDDPTRLEFFVRRGKSGTIAERLVVIPNAPFILKIVHDIKPVAQLHDVQVQIQCAKNKASLIDLPLVPSPSSYPVPNVPEDCKIITVSLLARAWSNKSDLQGEIHSIAILQPPV